MSRRTRTVLWIFGGSLLVGIVLLAALLLPRVGAARTLITFSWPVPDDLETLDKAPPGYELLSDADRYGAEHVLLRRIQDGKSHPTIVFVHGVAALGLRDGRILRAIEAFHRGGFTVVAPQIPPLMDPTRAPGELGVVDKVLAAVAADKVPGADGRRIGLVGISVGGAVALHAAARHQASGGRGLRAVFAIGAPDDLRTSAALWFAASDPAPEGGDDPAWQRRNAAAFARNFVLRAALPTRVGSGPEFEALRDWLAEKPLPTEKAPSLSRPAAQELARLVRAPPADREAAGEGLLADAWPRLRELSPADWGQDLESLRGVAVFLLHGEADPLVPVGDLDRLAERLRPWTMVSRFRSSLLGHTTVGASALGDRFDHVVFLDDFFDMVGG